MVYWKPTTGIWCSGEFLQCEVWMLLWFLCMCNWLRSKAKRCMLQTCCGHCLSVWLTWHHHIHPCGSQPCMPNGQRVSASFVLRGCVDDASSQQDCGVWKLCCVVAAIMVFLCFIQHALCPVCTSKQHWEDFLPILGSFFENLFIVNIFYIKTYMEHT